MDQLVSLGIGGGRIYDALIAFAAIKAQADRLVTLNVHHFQTLHPYLASRVSTP